VAPEGIRDVSQNGIIGRRREVITDMIIGYITDRVFPAGIAALKHAFDRLSSTMDLLYTRFAKVNE
jgi:hypothetical protein